MRRYYLILAILMPFAVFWYASTVSPTVGQASAATGQPSFTDDPVTGQITVDTLISKAVWNYKTSPSESNNQSGGNLYELYYKPDDPAFSHNLVSYVRLPNWGTGRDLTMPGVGGLGATAIYASTVKPPPNGVISPQADDQVSDNNLEGELASHSVYLDQNGNMVLKFTYKIKSLSGNATLQASGTYWYQVDKEWIVEPGGAIHLKIDWTILNNGFFSEPATRFNWNAGADVGWDRSVKYGRTWANESNPLHYVGIDGLQNESSCCWSELNMFWTESIALTGSATAPTMKMTADNNGQGYLGSGSHKLSMSLGDMGDTEEMCAYQHPIADSFGIGWYAWWGGYWPTGSRYYPLSAGTHWSDSWRIDLSQGPVADAPTVFSVNAQTPGSGSAQISWSTDSDSSSIVEFGSEANWTTKGQASALTKNHSLNISGLAPGSYRYRVKSIDAAGNMTVSDARSLTEPAGTPISLRLGQQSIYWVNYSDYLSRILSVGFQIRNDGSVVARSVSIVDIASSDGITINNSLPIVLGDLQGGSAVSFTAKYTVPVGLASFRTILYSTCIGPNGEQLNFP